MAGIGSAGVDVLLAFVGLNDANRNALRDQVFPTVASMRGFTYADLKDTSREYARRTVADGRIVFTRITLARLLGMIRWVQDS